MQCTMAAFCPICTFQACSFTVVLSHLRLVHSNDPNFTVICGLDGCATTSKSFLAQNTSAFKCLSAGETGSTATTTYCHHQALRRWHSHCSICNYGVSDLLLPRPFRQRPFSQRWISSFLFSYTDEYECNTGNHTFASVRGPEEYEFLKACFEPVWRELQELIQHPFIYINGREIQLEIILAQTTR